MLPPKAVIATVLAAGLLTATAPPGLAAPPGAGTHQAAGNAPQVRIQDSPDDYLITTTLQWSRAPSTTSQQVCTRIEHGPDTCQSGISAAATSYTAVTAAPAGARLGYYVVTCDERLCTRSSVITRTVP
jgi:hypothetical protein